MPWASEESFAIPTGYGDDRIVLMVKDPWWLFAYWEIQPSTERAARGRLLPHEVAGLQSILRVYDVTGVDDPASTSVRAFDIGLSGLATNWYIHVGAPNHAFLVEIGLLTTAARFLPLARSNRVTTPRFGPSDVLDEEWMTSDEAFWALLGAASGIGIGSSQSGSAHLVMQQMEAHPQEAQILDQVAALQDLPCPFALRGDLGRVGQDPGQMDQGRDPHQESPQGPGCHPHPPPQEDQAPPAHQPQAAGHGDQALFRDPCRHQVLEQLVGDQVLHAQADEDQAEQGAEHQVADIGAESHFFNIRRNRCHRQTP